MTDATDKIFTKADYVDGPDDYDAYCKEKEERARAIIKDRSKFIKQALSKVRLTGPMLIKIEKKLDLRGGQTLRELAATCELLWENEQLSWRKPNRQEIAQAEDWKRKELERKNLTPEQLVEELKAFMQLWCQRRVPAADHGEELLILRSIRGEAIKHFQGLVKCYLLGEYGEAKVDQLGTVKMLGDGNLFVDKGHLKRSTNSTQELLKG